MSWKKIPNDEFDEVRYRITGKTVDGKTVTVDISSFSKYGGGYLVSLTNESLEIEYEIAEFARDTDSVMFIETFIEIVPDWETLMTYIGDDIIIESIETGKNYWDVIHDHRCRP